MSDASAVINAGATVVLALLTGWYVFLTHRLARANQELVKRLSQPHVSIRAELDELYLHPVHLVVENVGSEAAYAVRFEIVRGPQHKDIEQLKKVGFIARGIEILAPRQSYRTFITTLLETLEPFRNAPLEIRATYSDAAGEVHQTACVVDFGGYENIHRLGEPPVFDLVKELRGIQQQLRSLVDAAGRRSGA